jgi:hypothetical protein
MAMTLLICYCIYDGLDAATFNEGPVNYPLGGVLSPEKVVLTQVAHTCALGTHFCHLIGVIYAHINKGTRVMYSHQEV